MASAPSFASAPDPPAAPAAESVVELRARLALRARASWAAVFGSHDGSTSSYADRQAFAVIRPIIPTTRNRGHRGLGRTQRPTSASERGGLWRF